MGSGRCFNTDQIGHRRVVSLIKSWWASIRGETAPVLRVNGLMIPPVVTLRSHVEVDGDHDGSYWGIDSPDSSSMYATASTLVHCRRLALGALRGEGIDTSDVRDVLIDARQLT